MDDTHMACPPPPHTLLGQGTASGTSRWAGMFSEITSVLGALRYAQEHGAVGVRVHMDSANLVRKQWCMAWQRVSMCAVCMPAYATHVQIDSPRDNWWDYYFANPMMLQAGADDALEVHLDGWIAKYGR